LHAPRHHNFAWFAAHSGKTKLDATPRQNPQREGRGARGKEKKRKAKPPLDPDDFYDEGEEEKCPHSIIILL